MLSRRDFLRLGTAGLGSSLLGPARALRDLQPPSPRVIWHGSEKHRRLALTYDDCYLLNRLHDLESLLAQFPGFRITLFPVGVALLNLARQDPGLWKRFLEQGHEIGYHSWDHGGIHVMSPASALADFDRWMTALIQVVGYQPTVRFGRPPFGVLSRSFDTIAQERGLVVTMWSTGWGGELDVGLAAARKSRNGDIVLLHIRTQDLLTSQAAFPWLQENAWQPVTLSHMYDDLLREENQDSGCDQVVGPSPLRTCLD
jgi:peptidoglycan/xylan/chitin deacetylase (PgdA/CDA1 family)